MAPEDNPADEREADKEEYEAWEEKQMTNEDPTLPGPFDENQEGDTFGPSPDKRAKMFPQEVPTTEYRKRVTGFAVIESMATITLYSPDYKVIRVWRDEEEIKDSYNNQDIGAVCMEHADLSISELAKKIALMERVNAVEVKNSSGFGIVLYEKWP